MHTKGRQPKALSEGRYKSPVLKAFNLFLIPVSLYLFLRDMSYGVEYAQVFFIIQITGVTASLVLLVHRNYSLAAIAMVMGVGISQVVDLVISGYSNVNSFYLVSYVFSLLLLGGTFFLSRISHILVLSAVLWIYFLHLLVSSIMRERISTEILSVDQQVAIPVVGFLVVTLLSLGVRHVFERIVKDQQTLLKECGEQHKGLGQLIRGIAHRLNTPLGNARMILSSGALDNLQGKSLLDEAVQQSTGLINRMRNFINATDFAVLTVQNLDAQLGLLGAGQKRRLEVATTPRSEKWKGAPLSHYWESIHLMVFELLQNAEQFSYGAHPTVLTIDVTRKNQWSLHIQCPDVVLSEEVQSKLTLPFFSTLNNPDHPGLGLYFVDHILRYVLGGQMTVTTDPHQGTAFHCEFPLEIRG